MFRASLSDEFVKRRAACNTVSGDIEATFSPAEFDGSATSLSRRAQKESFLDCSSRRRSASRRRKLAASIESHPYPST